MASEAVTAALFPQVFEIGMILIDYDVKRTTRTWSRAKFQGHHNLCFVPQADY